MSKFKQISHSISLKRTKNLQFNENVYNKIRKAETSFKSQRGRGKPYTLDAIWFFWQHKDKEHLQYLNEIQQHGFPTINLLDKPNLIGYLNGTIQTPENVRGSVLIEPTVLSREQISQQQQQLKQEERVHEKSTSEVRL